MTAQIQLSEVFSKAVPDDAHVFLMPTSAVADGYGVKPPTIRGHKKDRPNELIEGTHWVKDSQGNTQWTARGVIQLGFCTQSKQGEEFRQWAEQKIMGNGGAFVSQTLPIGPTDEIISTLDSTAAAIADVVVSQLSTEQMLQERVNFHVQAKLDAKVTAVDAASLGKGLAVQWGLQNMAALTEAIANLTGQTTEAAA